MGQYRYALDYHDIVNPAQGPKGDPAAGPIKIFDYVQKS